MPTAQASLADTAATALRLVIDAQGGLATKRHAGPQTGIVGVAVTLGVVVGVLPRGVKADAFAEVAFAGDAALPAARHRMPTSDRSPKKTIRRTGCRYL
jgi:hypothetical protein